MSSDEIGKGDRRITASEFWLAFAKALRLTVHAGGNWPSIYNTNGQWTAAINRTCRLTGEALGFRGPREIYLEYMKVDCGFFSIHPEEPGKGSCNWDWEVAIEFESNSRGWDWLEEFTRLSHLNAGLKVLITYLSFDASGADSCRTALDEAAKLYRQRRYQQANDNWLFIFGPRYRDLRSNSEIDFRAFQWSGADIFEELQSQRIIRV